LGVIGYVTFDLWPYWVRHPQDSDARWLRRQAALVFLDALLIGYGVALLSAVVATFTVALAWRRSRGRSSRFCAKLLLLCGAVLLSLLALEVGAMAWHAWLHRDPRLHTTQTLAHAEVNPINDVALGLPDQFRDRPIGTKDAIRPLKFLVIGESSGRGEPYDPWLSVGQIVAWRLGEVFPGRPVGVDIWATGGANLEVMHNKLAALSYRPDALIVYVGHNEFQARYSWMRDVDYYLDGDMAPRGTFGSAAASLALVSPLCRLVDEIREHQLIDMKPPRLVTRELIDRPVCTADEMAATLADFRRRLEAIASYCEMLETLAIFIIPPSNDGGFDPNRSSLAPETPKSERVAFARTLARARALEEPDRAEAVRVLRELIQAHPEFAESHYRLARLLAQNGCWDEARHHYVAARERDALPLRCPERFRAAFRDVASRHPGVLLIDGPKVLASRSLHGIIDDHFFHDAQHPNLRGYAALAEEILSQLGARRAFGWSAVAPVPVVDLASCVHRFQLDPSRWATVCSREAWFFRVIASVRYDPKFRNERAAAYERAAAALRAGVAPANAGIPSWPLAR
jgi:hypothetical protein